MIIYHDTRPCTPRGHSAFVGYDVYVGKMQSLFGRRSDTHSSMVEASPPPAQLGNTRGPSPRPT